MYNDQNNNEQNGYNNEGYDNGNQNQGSYYNSNDYAFKTVMRNNGRPKTLGWSLASMICGILAVVCCCLGWSSLVLGVAAITLSVVSRVNLGYFDGMSIAGLILGIFGLVFGIAMLVLILGNDEFWNEFWASYRESFENFENGAGGNTDF